MSQFRNGAAPDIEDEVGEPFVDRLPGGEQGPPPAHGVAGQERPARISGDAFRHSFGVAFEIYNGTAAQELLRTGVKDSAAAT